MLPLLSTRSTKSSSALWMSFSRRVTIVCGRILGEKAIIHKACRVGQGSNHGDPSASDLQSHESYFRWDSSMFVVTLMFSDLFNDTLSGRNRDYQDLNLTFALNIMKYSTIISMFPRPLKPCVVVSISAPSSPPLRPILVSWRARYRTPLSKSNKR